MLLALKSIFELIDVLNCLLNYRFVTRKTATIVFRAYATIVIDCYKNKSDELRNLRDKNKTLFILEIQNNSRQI